MRGEEDRVDGARRYAGDDVELDVRKMPGKPPEHADLIGCARSPARQNQREGTGLPGHAARLHGNRDGFRASRLGDFGRRDVAFGKILMNSMRK